MFLCPIKYFTIYCFSKILQDNKYNIFIAEIDSNYTYFFFEKMYLNTILHTPVHKSQSLTDLLDGTIQILPHFLTTCKVNLYMSCDTQQAANNGPNWRATRGSKGAKCFAHAKGHYCESFSAKIYPLGTHKTRKSQLPYLETLKKIEGKLKLFLPEKISVLKNPKGDHSNSQNAFLKSKFSQKRSVTLWANKNFLKKSHRVSKNVRSFPQ